LHASVFTVYRMCFSLVFEKFGIAVYIWKEGNLKKRTVFLNLSTYKM